MREEWVRIASFGTGLEADMARATLESAGIAALVDSPAPGLFGPGFQGAVPTGIALSVPASEAERARALLGVAEDIPPP